MTEVSDQHRVYPISKEGFKRYVGNTGYLLCEKIIRAVVNLTVWAYVIKYLGPEQFGILSYAISFVFLFNVLSELSLEPIAVKEFILSKRHSELLGSIFFVKSLGGFLGIILIVLATSFQHLDAVTRASIIILSLRFVFQSFDNVDYYFQARVLSKYTVYAQILGLMVTSCLCVLFIVLRKPLIYFIYVVVAEAAVIASGMIFLYENKLRKRISSWRVDFSIVRRLFKSAWPLILSGVAISVSMRFDHILLKNMLGAEAVGYYSAAVRVSEIFYFIPLILTSSLFPAIVNAKIKDNTLYQNRLEALFSFLALIAVLAAVFLTIFSPLIVRLLYGSSYAPSAAILMIHGWANVFVFLGVARTRWLINENLQIYLAPYFISAAVINVILNFALIPVLGIKGAALATVFSQFVAAMLSSLFSSKTRPVFLLQLSSFNFLKALKKPII